MVSVFQKKRRRQRKLVDENDLLRKRPYHHSTWMTYLSNRNRYCDNYTTTKPLYSRYFNVRNFRGQKISPVRSEAIHEIMRIELKTLRVKVFVLKIVKVSLTLKIFRKMEFDHFDKRAINKKTSRI